MHPICACSFHDYGCRDAVATGKRKRRQSSAFLMAIPLQQGQVFNGRVSEMQRDEYRSQSLCCRDNFLIRTLLNWLRSWKVAIPLQQGQVFNSGVCFFSLFSISCEGCFQLLPAGKS